MLFKINHINRFLLVLVKHKNRFKSTKISPSITTSEELNKLLLDMPRNRNFIAEAQKQRLKIKEKGSKYPPGTVNLQVLGSGAPGSPASVYLFTDHTRYLFNCGEGTQRLAHEHKTKLSRLEHIFMTRTSWNQIGGLPGLSLTVQDSGVPELTLHGPVGLDELFRGMRRFVVLKNLKVNAVNCEIGGEYDDSVMNVRYIPLKKKYKGIENSSKSPTVIDNNQFEETEVDNTDYYAYENNNDSQPSSPQQQETSSFTNIRREENTVICYICKLKPKPGILNLEKCVEKGVPPGPLLGQLKNGIDVTLPDGTLVRADDVRGATDPGPAFIFLDIPNEDYLEPLKEAHDIFSEYQSTTKDETKLAAVVIHFSPSNVIDTEIYHNFIEQFTPSTKHLMLNSSNKFSGNLAAHRIQWQLNQINPYVFPILKEDAPIIENVATNHKKPRLSNDIENDYHENEQGNSNSSHDSSSVQKGFMKLNLDDVKSLTCYYLRPKKGLDRTYEPSIEPSQYIQETEDVEGFKESLQELKIKLEEYYKEIKATRENDYPKIIFLGTGSCIPNKTRNVSSILIHTTPNSCILLDCGEGTYGQIIRFYGEKEAKVIIEKLKAVYISHLHADHHIGLIGLLRARQMLTKNIQPFLLFAPKQISSWLNFYNQYIESISKGYTLIPNGDIMEQPLSTGQLNEIAISSIITCPVSHCPHSFGVAIELDGKQINKKEPIKITYSGDTMPCDTLINIGKNSSLLIHEATMEDELKNEAKFKMHSTVSQAIEQGNKMNAKYTILTHFSQRYAKLPRPNESLKSSIGIAFDNMEVTFSDLNILHLMYPTLKIMFTEHCEEMEQKAYKRAMRQERKRQANPNDFSPTR